MYIYIYICFCTLIPNDLYKHVHVCTLCIFDILVSYCLYMSCHIKPMQYIVLTIVYIVITISVTEEGSTYLFKLLSRLKVCTLQFQNKDNTSY